MKVTLLVVVLLLAGCNGQAACDAPGENGTHIEHKCDRSGRGACYNQVVSNPPCDPAEPKGGA